MSGPQEVSTMVLAQAPGESRVAVRGFRAVTPSSAPSVMLSAFLPGGHLSLGGMTSAEARLLATMLQDAADFAEGGARLFEGGIMPCGAA